MAAHPDSLSEEKEKKQLQSLFKWCADVNSAISQDTFKRALTQNHALLNKTDRCGDTFLHVACRCNNEPLVKFLLDQNGIRLNIQNSYGRTPLHITCLNRFTELSELLLNQQGINCTLRDQVGTPLRLAYENKHFEIVKILVNKLEELDLNDKVFGHDQQNLLYQVCADGHLELAKLLVDKPGIALNRENFLLGHTPLTIAYKNGHFEIVKILVSKLGGCELNNRVYGFNKTYLLHQACADGYLNLAEFLVNTQGVELNRKNGDGDTPLHQVCADGHLDFAKLLVNTAGVELNSKNGWGKTPLRLAYENKYFEIVKILVDKLSGLELNDKVFGNHEQNLLHQVCADGHLDLAELLVEKAGIELSSMNASFRTPLNIARTNNHLKIKKLLQEKTRQVSQKLLSLPTIWNNIDLGLENEKETIKGNREENKEKEKEKKDHIEPSETSAVSHDFQIDSLETTLQDELLKLKKTKPNDKAELAHNLLLRFEPRVRTMNNSSFFKLKTENLMRLLKEIEKTRKKFSSNKLTPPKGNKFLFLKKWNASTTPAITDAKLTSDIRTMLKKITEDSIDPGILKELILFSKRPQESLNKAEQQDIIRMLEEIGFKNHSGKNVLSFPGINNISTTLHFAHKSSDANIIKIHSKNLHKQVLLPLRPILEGVLRKMPENTDCQNGGPSNYKAAVCKF